jgi:glutamate racemase
LNASDFWRGAEKMSYYLLFPALIIHGLVHVDLSEHVNNIMIPIVLSTVLLGLALIGLNHILHMNKAKFTSYFQGAIPVIDTSLIVAAMIKEILSERDLLIENQSIPTRQFYVSDYTDSFEKSTQIFFGETIKLTQYPIWD